MSRRASALELGQGREGILNRAAKVRGEEDAGGATQRGLKHAVALRVAAEPGCERRLQERATSVDQLDETQQADSRAVRGKWQAHVFVEMPADFSGAGVGASCDLGARNAGVLVYEAQGASRERVCQRADLAERVSPSPQITYRALLGHHVPVQGGEQAAGSQVSQLRWSKPQEPRAAMRT